MLVIELTHGKTLTVNNITREELQEKLDSGEDFVNISITRTSYNLDLKKDVTEERIYTINRNQIIYFYQV
jgi:hypothetical protein